MADQKCPWCGKETKELVRVFYMTKSYVEGAYVCAPCRKAWLDQLRQGVMGKRRKKVKQNA